MRFTVIAAVRNLGCVMVVLRTIIIPFSSFHNTIIFFLRLFLRISDSNSLLRRLGSLRSEEWIALWEFTWAREVIFNTCKEKFRRFLVLNFDRVAYQQTSRSQKIQNLVRVLFDKKCIFVFTLFDFPQNFITFYERFQILIASRYFVLIEGFGVSQFRSRLIFIPREMLIATFDFIFHLMTLKI